MGFIIERTDAKLSHLEEAAMKKFLIGLSEPGLLLKKTDQLLLQLLHLHGELPHLAPVDAGNWDISAPVLLQTTSSPSHPRGGQTE